MNMKISQILVTGALVTSQANAAELFVKKSFFSEFTPVVAKFETLEKRSTVGGYPVLPVADQMLVVDAKVLYSTGVVVPQGRITAFSWKNGKFEVGLEVNANLSQASASDWTDTPCKREDYIWKRSVGGKFKDMNCVSINHITNNFVNPKGSFQQLTVDIREKGIEIPPPTIVRVTFTRYTSEMRRLSYVVDINPEIYGIERDATSVWGSNSWYKDYVRRDPKKSLFLDHLIKWSTDVQNRMNAAFDKDPDAFKGLGMLDGYLKANVAEPQSSVDQNEALEAKLLKLKNLFDKGLLTEVQYNEQVKEALSGK